MIKRLKCWLGSHEWGEYKIATMNFVMCDKRGLTGRDGETLKTEIATLRTCDRCKREERLSRDLGWVKV